MNIITTEHKQTSIQEMVVVTLRGRITVLQAHDLREHFSQLIADNVKHFILDLSEVEFLDSAGLAALVTLLKQAQPRGGGVKMILPKLEAAKRILRLTRFDKVFPIIESVDAATNVA